MNTNFAVPHLFKHIFNSL